jgi:hypothetical protein
MAKHSFVEVATPSVWINEITVLGFGNGVDRQVAPSQVLFERNVRVGADLESRVAGSGLRFRSCQRIFFLRIRMQVYREAAPDTLKAACFELVTGRADDDPVTFGDRQAE